MSYIWLERADHPAHLSWAVCQEQTGEVFQLITLTWLTSKQMTYLPVCFDMTDVYTYMTWVDLFNCANQNTFRSASLDIFFVSGCKQRACTKGRSSSPATVLKNKKQKKSITNYGSLYKPWLMILYSKRAPAAAYTHLMHMYSFLWHQFSQNFQSSSRPRQTNRQTQCALAV